MLSNSLPPNKNINSINILGDYDNNMNTEDFKAEVGVGLQRESNMWAEYLSNKKKMECSFCSFLDPLKNTFLVILKSIIYQV